MRLIRQILRDHRYSALTVVAGVMFGVLLFAGGATASAADCDNNSIIKCGFTSASNFISTVNSNNSGNGHADLKGIYAYYGLQPSSYNQFVASAKLGTAYRDGRIVVDGQTVATGAKSIGRLASSQGPGYFTTSIPNVGTYYGNTDQNAFAASTTSIPVMVMFNNQGQVQFAVLTACGNPIYGTNVPANYSCDTIHKTAVSGKANTYNFTASATQNGNAAITKYTYDFGDGTAPVSEPNGTTVVQHTYATPGTYTASVTVTVTLPGSQTVTATSLPCKTTIVVVAPYTKCVQLNGAILDQSKYSYSYVVTVSFGNGATFTGADFDFGDGKSTKDVTPNGTTATTTHQYAAAGNYRITATVHFSAYGKSSSQTCYASVSPTQPPTPECKPGIPEGSPLCTPCQYNSSIPSNDSKCVAPAGTLPNTGAGDVIAIFGAVAVAGFLIFRQFIYKKHVMAGNAMAMNLEHQVLTAHHHAAVHHEQHATHPNAGSALHHPTYKKPRRFRPSK